jgi:predicted Zn-dependent protease
MITQESITRTSLRSSLRFGLLVSLILSITAGCAVNPVTGKRELNFISEGQELSIGEAQYEPSQQSQGGTFKVDQALTRYVNMVGQRVAQVSDRALPYEFVVLNNPVPNAWALPGGKIAVNRGLLVELNSEAELAAVLGHEVVHAAARHGANAMQRGLVMQGLMMATAIGAASSEYGNYIVGGAQLGAQLVTTKYGRDAELEADYYGMQYMARAGYDPKAAIGLQETFVRLSQGRASSWLDGLFASHPPSMERVDKNRQTALELNASGEINEAQYREKMAILTRLAPAYAAQDVASKLAANKDMPAALLEIDKAIKLAPNEARFYGVQGEILLSQKHYAEAVAAYSTALKKDNSYFEYYLGRGLARARLGETQSARVDLEQSYQLLPTALASNELGQIALTAGDTTTAKAYFETAMSAGGDLGARAGAAFTRLDIVDNPQTYLRAQPVLSKDGVLVAVVTNPTDLFINNITVAFSANLNELSVNRTLTLTRLAPGTQRSVSSGWQFSAEDRLTNVRVRVISAVASEPHAS